jgi:D-alanyl-D-alanine carboxypeptidase (penicillin-binding protein 5/6)
MRNILIILSSFFALTGPAAIAQIAVPSPPQLDAKGFLLIDHTSGHVLAEKASGERLEPASITKLMTAYAVFRGIGDGQIALKDEVLVSEKAWRTPGSRMFIEVGTRVTVEELLLGMIVQSGNDASVALAEHIGGSEETFAQVMNQYAAELGMNDTSYRNSTGLPDPDHYTSARDIAVLAQALIAEFPEYYRWYSQKSYAYNGITQSNRNSLLWRDSSVDGIKTGHTDSAGYCLVSSAERDGMRLISVVLGTKSTDARTAASAALLNYGFRFYETRRLYTAGQDITEARVWKGDRDTFSIGVGEDVFVTIPRGAYDRLEAQLELPARIIAPVAEGSDLGTVAVTLAGSSVAQASLKSLANVDRGGLWQRARDTVLMWLE